MSRLTKPLDRMKPHYDVVIVGSGYAAFSNKICQELPEKRQVAAKRRVGVKSA